MSEDCVYCGAPAETRDHVVPLSYHSNIDRKRTHKRGISYKDTVPACRECNSTLHTFFAEDVFEKAEYLAERYSRKYKKILNSPEWSEEELDEMGKNLRRQIEALQFRKSEITERIRNLTAVSRGYIDKAVPLWAN